MALSGQLLHCHSNTCPELKTGAIPKSNTSKCRYERYLTYSAIYLEKYDNGKVHQPVHCLAVPQKSGVQVQSYVYGTIKMSKKVKIVFDICRILVMGRLITITVGFVDEVKN